MSKILLTTYGSYGDLHPFIAMGKVLSKNNYEVTIATHLRYKEMVERVGLRFLQMKPNGDELGPEESWTAKAHNPVTGYHFILNDIILPYLNDSYNTLEKEMPKYDLVISHSLTFATPLVAEKYNIPWISCVLQPAALFSSYDPSAIGALPFLAELKFLGPAFLG